MYSSMEIVILAAKRQVRGSTYGEQGRLNDGADAGGLAELRTTTAAPERAVGPDRFRASSIASDLNSRWTFSSVDVAGNSVVGHEHRDSVSDVVEDEAQSIPHFGRRSAYSADRLGLPAKWVSVRSRSNIVLVGGKHGRSMGQFGIRRCGRFVAVLLVFLRKENRAKAAIR